MIRRTIAAFRAGERTPEMKVMIYPNLDAAAAIEARFATQGLYRPRSPSG
jgi:hypothetical protein